MRPSHQADLRATCGRNENGFAQQREAENVLSERQALSTLLNPLIRLIGAAYLVGDSDIAAALGRISRAAQLKTRTDGGCCLVEDASRILDPTQAIA